MNKGPMPQASIKEETGYVGYKRNLQERIANARKSLARDEKLLALIESNESVQTFLQLANTPFEEQ